jgi:hypothetical protein
LRSLIEYPIIFLCFFNKFSNFSFSSGLTIGLVRAKKIRTSIPWAKVWDPPQALMVFQV